MIRPARLLPAVFSMVFGLVGLFPSFVRADRLQDRITQESQARTGAQILVPDWSSSEVAAADLTADGLAAAETVQIALMANTQLQEAFNELGIARADIVAAGLYANPELDVLLRFPESGPSNDMEVDLGFSIADLWLVPIRRKMARAAAEQGSMDVVNAVLNTVADARLAHNDCLVAQAIRDQAEQILKAARAWRDRVYLRSDFGFTSELDKAGTDAFVAEQQMNLSTAQSQVKIALARLYRVAGLQPSPGAPVRIVGSLPEPPTDSQEPDVLVAKALARRPDVLASRLGVSVSREALRLQRHSVWSDLTFGPSYAHETDGRELWGASLRLGLPLFHRNRGGRAHAAARLRQRQGATRSLEARVREEVAVAVEQLALAVRQERTIREELLPARKKALDYATEYYMKMQLNMLRELEARRELYVAQQEHIAALGAIRAAQIELEFVIGGRNTTP